MEKLKPFILSAFTLLVGAQSVFAASAAFRDYKLDDAKAAAKQENKMLVIDFTASWCGPCHRMEKDTWSDPAVLKWIADNAVVVQYDVDKEKALSESFKIAAMPSVVAFSDKDQSKEFDRHVGYLNATELLNWLAAVKNGGTWLDVLKAESERLASKGGEEALKARRKYAVALMDKSDYAAAGPEYLWLWQNIPKVLPDMKNARLPMLGRDIIVICAKDPATKESFSRLRDESEKSDVVEFIVLNLLLNDESRTLSWFDQVKSKPEEKENLKKVGFLLEKLFVVSKRWSDIALLYPDPIEELNARVASSEKFKAQMEKQGVKAPADMLRGDLPFLYVGLLAAHKESDARKYAAECLKVDNSAEMQKALVKLAIIAGEPRKEQLKWVGNDAELKAKLQTALADKAKK